MTVGLFLNPGVLTKSFKYLSSTSAQDTLIPPLPCYYHVTVAETDHPPKCYLLSSGTFPLMVDYRGADKQLTVSNYIPTVNLYDSYT